MHVLPEIREKFLNNSQTFTEANKKFFWAGDCNNTFNKLKDPPKSFSVLAYPEIGKQFILDTDEGTARYRTGRGELLPLPLRSKVPAANRSCLIDLATKLIAVRKITGYSPSQMLFGRDLRLPADLSFFWPPDAPLAPE
ncbi:hypothetical protein TNCV_2536281 [Trichonephila clavipes]|nr:hypothetical protein TNCV_2536281 [Trichonephila clavipes]